MNQAFIVLEALLLGAIILGAEWRRQVPHQTIDFLRATSAVYFMCFVVIPVYLQLDDLRDMRDSIWAWLLKWPFDGEGFVYAGVFALIGYASLLLGFHLAGGGRRRVEARRDVGLTVPAPGRGSGSVLVVALILGMTGLICLTVYTVSIGGLAVLVLQAAAFRGSSPPVVTAFAFLKTLSPMVMAGAILLHAVRSRAHLAGKPRGWMLTFVVFLVGSLLILIHQAGRFPVVVFLLTFPLATVLRTGRLRLPVALGASVLVFFFLLFGKQLFESTINETTLTGRVEAISRDARKGVRLVLLEFAFPAVTAANASLEVPDQVAYRWFYDFPLAVEYLVPQRLLGIEHPPTVSMINTARFPAFGTIPVDLVSLGFVSAGVPGLVLVMVAFGALLTWFERALPATSDSVDCVLRSAWILFISVRVMYGDPQLIWPGGLHLIVMAVLLFAMRILAERHTMSAREVSTRSPI